jgi:hypothetical protein
MIRILVVVGFRVGLERLVTLAADHAKAGRGGLVVVAALVQPGRRVLRELGVLVNALSGVGLGAVDHALGVGSALNGGDPRLLGVLVGLLERVVVPEGAEGGEVVVLLLAGLGAGPGVRAADGGGRRVFIYLRG